jgi:tetratricopeptide (TPR) repeat protein
MSAGQRLPILVLTENPALNGLTGSLWAQGFEPIRISTTEEVSTVLGIHRGRCVALLDAHRPARYSFGAVYQLLHTSPPVPTLIVLGAFGGAAAEQLMRSAPPSDDCLVLPMDLTEIAQRARALAERALLPLPPVADAVVAAMAPRSVPVAAGRNGAGPGPPLAAASALPGSPGTPTADRAATHSRPSTSRGEAGAAPAVQARGRGALILGGLLLVVLAAVGLLAQQLAGAAPTGPAQAGDRVPEGAGSLFVVCQDAVAAGTWEAAVAACQQAQQAPGYPGQGEALTTAYVGLGRQRLAQGEPVETALTEFRRALEIDPEHREALEESRRASRYVEGEHALAAQDWPTATEKFGQVYSSARGYLSGAGDRAALARLYQAELGWGMALLTAQSYTEARRHCGRALDLVPRGADAEACVAAINTAQPPTLFPTVLPRPTRITCC